ncbi:thiosulfate sulfurtransferas-like protein [Lepidopterella palustris CBS 459.81]|uniref:Thiosulfate sulfurtransferas-like protein n=1 Tax=Lepidopterella palustris CBS 459.81 TaxID=1314670 RepID=A0A8E2E9X6_9PEZI|nr:thiosulfate sulfurtransferas-like protein [Lepidopterella palustris CBS 459.81]
MRLASFRGAIRPLVSFSSRPPGTVRRTMSQYTLSSYLVTPAQLNSALQKNIHSRLSTAPRIIPLCATWFLPNDGRNGIDTFIAGRIPRARFFDLDAVKDPNSPYPHMLPSPEDFASAMGQLGIRRDDSVVVYDSKELGIFSAPRVGWTLRAFGHSNVHILNNFRLWCEEGYPVESGEPEAVDPVEYAVPQLDMSKVVAFEQVKEIALEQGKEGAEEVQILDARSEARWRGTEPEPRPGLPSGHIPHSISVPVSALLDAKTKAFLTSQELQTLFKSKGIDPSKPIITSCGTGVTAAVIDAALIEAGYPEDKKKLYDGSWTEWAQRVKPSDNLILKFDE